jgi:hypothetical protein
MSKGGKPTPGIAKSRISRRERRSRWTQTTTRIIPLAHHARPALSEAVGCMRLLASLYS